MNPWRESERSHGGPLGLGRSKSGCWSQANARPLGRARWASEVSEAFDAMKKNVGHRTVSIAELSPDRYETVGETALSNEPHRPKMASTHDGRFVYVVDYPPESGGADLYEIDQRYPHRIARMVGLPAGRYRGLAVHCPSSRVFLSDSANRTIWVINRNHFTIQWQISLEGGAPGDLAMSPNGDVLYALSTDGNSLWVIDPHSNRVLGFLTDLDRTGTEVAAVADGSQMFVSHWRKDGELCVARVLAKSRRERTRTVFAVDAAGNCWMTQRVGQSPAAA